MSISVAFQELIASISQTPVLVTWISICGAIAAILSILFHVIKWIADKPKIKIEYECLTYDSMYYRVTEDKKKKYNFDACAIVSLVIINRSPFPTTVYRIWAKFKNIYKLHDSSVTYHTYRQTLENNLKVDYHFAEPVKLPVRLNAYDSVIGRVSFVDVAKHIDKKTDELKFSIFVDSTLKTKHKRVVLENQEQYHQSQKKRWVHLIDQPGLED